MNARGVHRLAQGGRVFIAFARVWRQWQSRPMLPQTPTEAWALGEADGYRRRPPLVMFTEATQDAYTAGYRQGRRLARRAGAR
jgi:hypothetical protein